MLEYNILFRWFLDMNLEQPGLDRSKFSRLRERLVEQDTARRFFDAVVRAAREANLLCDEHFTVDGTLIEAWARLKSFKSRTMSTISQIQNDRTATRMGIHIHQCTVDFGGKGLLKPLRRDSSRRVEEDLFIRSSLAYNSLPTKRHDSKVFQTLIAFRLMEQLLPLKGSLQS